MTGLLRHLVRRRDGSAAVEFALTIPVLAGILFASMDFAGVWMMRLRLEQAAQRGIELAGMRDSVPSDGNFNYILTEAQTAYGRTLSSSAVNVWLECGGTVQNSLDNDCGTLQRAIYVSLQLRAEYRPVFNWGGRFRGGTSNNGILVSGDATLRLQ